MSTEQMLIIVPIIAAIIGALSGYIAARYKSRHEKELHLDELAKCLAEKEMELAREADYQSRYGFIGNWVIARELLEYHDSLSLNNERLSSEEILKKVDDRQRWM